MGRIYGILVLLALVGAIFASGAEEIAAGKALAESKVSCGKLTDEELESIGEYIMEQMHPGKAHEYMDNMMGGEGSASLKNAHIQMAQVIYCGQTDTQLTYGGMMGMGMMGYGGGMMGGYGAGITGGYGGMMGRGATGGYGGMMGNYGFAGFGWSLIDILLVILLIGLILVVYAHAWQKLKGEGRKKA